jgi:outer membrane protein OmpA-like peptidoglycan-associated protein
MRRLLIALLLPFVVLFACKKHEPSAAAPPSSADTAATTAGTAAATSTSLPSHDGENLVALASGAMPVVRASAPEQGGETYYMFDEDPTTGWASNDGKYAEPTVVELADRGVIKSVAFDEQRIAYDGRLPHEVLVEMSDTSPTDGFKPIADVTMSEMKDGQTFPVSAEVPGRWVRLTVKKAASDAAIAQIMEFRAFGNRLTHNPMPNVTGTYDTNVGMLHLKQEGATVTGCYDRGTEPLIGGMEGRILKFKYATGENGSGPALVVISDKGDLFGGWWRTDSTVVEHPTLDPIEGKRTSTDPGNTACPQWSSPAQQMAEEIKSKGRVRLYGINFDSDSDVIREESKPTLDQVAAMLKSAADLHLTIEGHTDSTATPEHNQDLSTRRANAVLHYLVNAGIAANRLDATGFGATKPIASNDTPFGRAANRRVELVKK